MTSLEPGWHCSNVVQTTRESCGASMPSSQRGSRGEKPPVEHIEQLVFGEVGENVEQDRIAALDTTGEVEDSDARDTEGSKQDFTVFVPELIMIAGERQAGADAQAIQRLECRPIADDRCRYGAEDGAQRSEGEAKRIGDTGGR